ncbi:ShlB/FhaC/HecB family hemolysin secretion/activation protein, partial [Morganella morganii]|uniref:ShlB/FhaC/HecB family hemolysin secretion/activation protein n=1 Tax=Morganella morganii TaxID=582 RepID=UPI0019DC856E
LSYIQQVSLPEDAYLLSSHLAGQYTQEHLPGGEWLTLSDNISTRGFHDGSLAAEKGWYWQNTLSRRFVRQGSTVTPRVGADSGRVEPEGGV